jgi:hypothetical protein
MAPTLLIRNNLNARSGVGVFDANFIKQRSVRRVIRLANRGRTAGELQVVVKAGPFRSGVKVRGAS